ncbi:hypothetical protein [Agromyces sp. SYSU T0242]|uniref:hypothetical protein n=1 Tax=Agromyces litoreus TaxID=3158561 RepID=UPI003396B271
MTDAERIAELQRLAYGAGSDVADRARAERELAALREPSGRAVAVAVAPSGGRPSVPASDSETPPDERGGAWPDGIDPADDRVPAPAPSAPVVRVAGLAAAIALAIGFAGGLATGLNLAGAVSEPDVPDSELVFPLADPAEQGLPLEGSLAAEVFERAQSPSDLPESGSFVESMGFDAASIRKLASLPDGTSVHVARASDGDGICLFTELPEVGGGSSCTPEPVFPAGGVRVAYEQQGGDWLTVIWGADGALTVLD